MLETKMRVKRAHLHVIPLLLIFAFMSIASGGQYGKTISATGTVVQTNFVDRWITWDDGSVDQVQIGKDGFFVLNGTKKRLVGFDLGTTGLPIAFWDSADLEIIEKELVYLQSVGVRIITLDLFYVGLNNELDRYSPILDMLYEHKMLVWPVITGKYLENANNFEVFDFPITGKYGDDTMGNWLRRWLDVVTSYDNVVGISLENEISNPPPGHTYTVETIVGYISWMKEITRAKTNLPLNSKLYFTTAGPGEDIKRGVLGLVDIVSCTDYSFSLVDHENRLMAWVTLMGECGWSGSGWWIGELNKYKDGGASLDTPNFTMEYIEQSFNYGASVVCLFTMNRYQDPNWAFFDANGDPVNTLLRIASEIQRLQQ